MPLTAHIPMHRVAATSQGLASPEHPVATFANCLSPDERDRLTALARQRAMRLRRVESRRFWRWVRRALF